MTALGLNLIRPRCWAFVLARCDLARAQEALPLASAVDGGGWRPIQTLPGRGRRCRRRSSGSAGAGGILSEDRLHPVVAAGQSARLRVRIAPRAAPVRRGRFRAAAAQQSGAAHELAQRVLARICAVRRRPHPRGRACRRARDRRRTGSRAADAQRSRAGGDARLRAARCARAPSDWLRGCGRRRRRRCADCRSAPRCRNRQRGGCARRCARTWPKCGRVDRRGERANASPEPISIE